MHIGEVFLYLMTSYLLFGMKFSFERPIVRHPIGRIVRNATLFSDKRLFAFFVLKSLAAETFQEKKPSGW